MQLEDLVNENLVGGILVEYKDNTGFGLEYGRANIMLVGIREETFEIRTDNEDACHLDQNISEDVKRMGYRARVEKRGEIYYISSAMGYCYVAAPKGVEIPGKPNYLDVTDQEFVDEVKRHWGADTGPDHQSAKR